MENLIVSRLQTHYKSAVALFKLLYGPDDYLKAVPIAMEAVVHYYDAYDNEVCIVKSEVSNQSGSKL